MFWQIVFMALTGFIVLAGVKKGIERYHQTHDAPPFRAYLDTRNPGMHAGWGHGRDKIFFLTQVLGTYFTGSTFCSGTGLFLLINRYGVSS